MGAVRCLACGAVLISRSRHDYVTCGCPQGTLVDGGDDYTKCGGMNMSLVQVLHPILLVPLDKDGKAKVDELPNGAELLAVIDQTSKLVDLFPDFPDPTKPEALPLFTREDEELFLFSPETKLRVCKLRSGLVALREARFKQLTAKPEKAPEEVPVETKPNEKKSSRRSTKAGPKKEQPGAPS